MLTDTIETKIRSRLQALEAERGFRILFACESGSRAWGFASADSDYDVRFIYVWPRDRYLSVFDPADSVDLAIDSDDIDLSGWDFRKSLGLFRKSNGALCEWLRSSIVYREDGAVMAEWRSLLDRAFVPQPNAAHYFGLFRKMWHVIAESPTVTAKRYLYAVRALLSARCVAETLRPAPVGFVELRAALSLPDSVSRRLDELIREKASGLEKDGVGRDSTLDGFLAGEQERLKAIIDTLPAEMVDTAMLDHFFRSVI